MDSRNKLIIYLLLWNLFAKFICS